MFVAPLVVPAQPRSRSRQRRLSVGRELNPRSAAHGRVDRGRPAQKFLLAWIALGLVVVACVPAARGDALLGATLPFWLVVAPLLNLAWVVRARVWHAMRRRLRRPNRRRVPPALRIKAAASRRQRNAPLDAACAARATGTGSSTAGSMPPRSSRQ
jgi:hypothetical protein